MVVKEHKILVTSALPYVNNIPHLGTLVCVVSADVYARYLRIAGKNVVFVLGTDEHGTTAEQKAREEGLTPRELVNKYFKKHSVVYDWFGISPDCYGRTSSKKNHEITQEVYADLLQNKYIVKQVVEQAYDEKEKTFLADRFVEGTCPFCEYTDARGDQCDNCSKLLNPEELINPRSKLSNSPVVFKSSEHAFIDLPKISPLLHSWIKETSAHWSKNARTTTLGYIKEGLKPRAITRDLRWGIPVPDMKHKVFYSWFDAPIGYIGITAEHHDNWKNWWKNKNTELVQFMGKDNIVFHTVLFPAFLLGTKKPWTLVKKLSVNEYLNYESGKFSKSRGVGVFADDAVSTGIPSDVWRYYLMINRPEQSDTEFSWDDFQDKLNKELVGNIGNLVNRTLTFIQQFAGGRLSVPGKDIGQGSASKNIIALFEAIELKQALKAIMQLSSIGNQYFQKMEPWKKKESDELPQILANLALFVKDLSILLTPYLPATSARIQALLGLPAQHLKDLGIPLPVHTVLPTPEILFTKLEDKEKQEFRKKFGKQTKQSTHSGKDNAILPKTGSAYLLDLRVAKIVTVTPHPEAEKLYVLTVIADQPRTIVAGLRPYYESQELVGKLIIIVANLAHAKLRGIVSQGMLLAGEHDGVVKVLEAPASAKPGDTVIPKGVEFKTAQKVSIDSVLAAQLVVKEHVAYSKSTPLVVGKEVVRVALRNGSIR